MPVEAAEDAPDAPDGLGEAGRALWVSLSAEFEFGPHELALLAVACRQADDVAALEGLLGRDGLVVTGSAGQPRLNAAVTEVRQGRLALAKLLDQLAIPDEEQQVGRSAASRRAQRAARIRWDRDALRGERGTA
jgi:hypothetical protein